MSRDSVDIRMLRRVTNQIFDFIEHDLGLSHVRLGRDFYWTIPDKELYEMGNKPDDLEVGSLIDDIEFVVSAGTDKESAVPLDLLHLAPILKALSVAVPSYKSPDQ